MVKTVIDLDSELDRKVNVLKAMRNDKSKKDTLEFIVKTYFEKSDLI